MKDQNVKFTVEKISLKVEIVPENTFVIEKGKKSAAEQTSGPPQLPLTSLELWHFLASYRGSEEGSEKVLWYVVLT